jgi:carnitine-CoA ligase
MTETAMVTRSCLRDARPPGTCGKLFGAYEARIVDAAGRECPNGAAGEVMVRPLLPNALFKGYWRRPEASLQAMRDLWFRTGDIGRFDADGYFIFVDRGKDYLRRGGENISSFEMETSFRQHPAIDDVAVHAVLSEITEDEVKVTAVLKAGASLGEEELCRWSLDRVPHFAVPRYIEFRTDLPRNPVGRVLKYQLRAEGVTANTWDRHQSTVIVTRR